MYSTEYIVQLDDRILAQDDRCIVPDCAIEKVSMCVCGWGRGKKYSQKSWVFKDILKMEMASPALVELGRL